MAKQPRLRICLAVIAAGLLLAGCSGGHPGLHVVSGASAGIKRAELNLVSGASSVTVNSVALGGALYRVSTLAGSGLIPVAYSTCRHAC